MLDACGAGHGDGATAALAAPVAGRRGLGVGWAKTITLRPRGIVIGFPFLFTLLFAFAPLHYFELLNDFCKR